MRSPALAISWEFRHRHRWVLIGFVGYLLVLAAIKLLVIGPGQPVTLDPPDGRAAAVIVPLSATFFYLLAVFSHGLVGDLAGRQSIYPPRMFALPVTTRALAGWPMLYGTTVMATLWLVTAGLARWPWQIELPLIWPGLLAAVFLAWTQALTWMPYGLPGFRVVITVLWLAALDAAVLLAIHFRVSEAVLVAVLAPQLPLAFLAACYAVGRARRGEVPDWRVTSPSPGTVTAALPSRRNHFPSPARAQQWFEWRRHGRTLPAWVGLLLPFELALLWLANDTPALVLEIVLLALVTPPFMAAFIAATVSRPDPGRPDSYHLTPFTASRPSTSAGLIAAKLTMTIWSTLAAWLVVLVAVPLALSLSGTWPELMERVSRAIDAVGTLRAIVLGLLGFLALLASTWKQLVQSLYLGLTGRQWVIRSSVAAGLAVLIIVGPLAQWIHDNSNVQATLWDAVPWILAALVATKMVAATWVANRLVQSRLMSDRTLVTGATGWALSVLGLYGLLAWLFSMPFLPRYLFALVAILAIPLTRLSASPLALAWNRHR